MLIDRRTFLGLLSGASFGSGLLLGSPLAAAAAGSRRAGVVNSVCDHDCGGRCLMRVHVRDGRIEHITTDDGGLSAQGYGYHAPDRYQLRTCNRGRAYRAQLDAPDRILRPMKRVGPRGEGRFAPITWNEALATVAARMRGIAGQHGPAAIFSGAGSGTSSALNASFDLQLLLARLGGLSTGWTQPSWEGARFAMEYTLGLNDRFGPAEYADGADGADFLNSKLIIMWGWNPAYTHFGTTTKYHLQRAREAGIPIVCVDPVYTDTAAMWGSEWIPIRPGGDAAVLMAMAHVILEEDLADRDFVDRLTEGMPEYRDHLRGKADGIVKDPRWAAAISDVPAETIVALARRYATARPANLVAGYAPGRTRHGEQYHRAAIALQALTGNIGRPGGGSAGLRVGMPVKFTTVIQTWWQRFLHDLDIHDANIASIKTTRLAEAILEGRHVDPASVGSYRPLPSDIRMLYCVAWNPLNQQPNINKTVRALEKLDFIVVQDQRLTPTARWADILLPACTMLEREDFTLPWRECEPHLLAQEQAVQPYGQSRPDHWIFDRLARRLRLKPLRLGRSPRAWLDHLLSLDQHGPFAKLARAGALREERATPWVAFRDQVEAPEKYPFQTPSGRIEIRSRHLSTMDFVRTSYGQPIPALPTHLDGEPEPAERRRHPLQLLTTKLQFRCHSTLTGNPLLEEYFRQEIWIHPRDASVRGIGEGLQVIVANERGRLACAARLSERIKPGVVMIHEGAWYRPAADGTDLSGNPNVLTSDEPSPGGAFAYNSAWVDVLKA